MKKILVFTLVALSFSFGINAKKINLVYNLQKGSKYNMNQTSTQKIHQEINGMANDMEVVVSGNTSYEVTDIQDGVFVLKMVYETLQFELKSQMINLSYKSDETIDEPNPMQKALSAIIGVPFEVKMDNKGNIVSVSGFENVYKSIANNFGGDNTMVSQIAESLKQQFGNESVKGNLEIMTKIFPEESVSVGDSWTINSTVNAGMALSTKNVVTLVSGDKNTWKLSGNAEMSTGTDSKMEMNGMIQTFEMSGKISFDMNLDPNSGWMKESATVSNLEGKVSIESDQLPAPMEIPMSIQSESKMNSL